MSRGAGNWFMAKLDKHVSQVRDRQQEFLWVAIKHLNYYKLYSNALSTISPFSWSSAA